MLRHLKAALIILILLAQPLLSAESPMQSEPDYHASIASQNPGIFQNQTILISGREGYTHSDKNIFYKSEEKAFLLALYPGFFIHGLGHFYAGEPLTGLALLGIESISFLLVTGLGIGDFYGNKSLSGKFGFQHILFGAGLAGFFGS